MRIEICCPTCNKGYLLDEASLSGEFCCPACSTPIKLSAASVGAQPPSTPATTPQAPTAPATETAAAVVSETAAPAAVAVATETRVAATTVTAVQPTPAPSGRREVVCPRCNLHFSPRGKATAPDPRTRPTALVVEDMGYFQEIAQDALSADFEVRLASSAAEARKVMAEQRIDLMVLDLNLDNCDDGPQLLSETRSMSCPVLIYTARDESEMYGEEWDELRELGADDIVIKGMNVAESLKRKAAALLGRPYDDEENIE